MDKYDLAICISTFNRKETFERCIHSFRLHTPYQIPIMVVDDFSDENYANADYRFNERSGISKVKNKSLHLCYDTGKLNFLLLDDDVLALKDDWHIPYLKALQDGKNHLCRTFYKPRKSINGIDIHVACNGSAMFYSKDCIDKVGGFDTTFNNKFEHTELTRRIHNAGLTEFQCQDVTGSNELIYLMDEFNEIPRSFSKKEMDANLKAGYDHFNATRNSTEYHEFKHKTK